MCRLVAYLGSEILLEEILVKPSNSIVMQSLKARESTVPTNGDGFGLGWYTPSISSEPALFVSIFPAWSDRNLLYLTAKIKSSSFFAHVRAASVGGTNNYNCHPFVYKQWMLMHNGGISDFMSVKRHLRHLLDDDIYNWIQGETDSEHLFALFLQLAKGKDLTQLAVVADTLQETIKQINQLVKQYGTTNDPSLFNICLTDGQRIVASRYSSNKKIKPESMHYSAGSIWLTPKDRYYRPKRTDVHDCVLITSERLNDFKAEWQSVPPNHFLLVDTERRIHLRKLKC
ncbi:glutamine amidotransferase [Legionella beliardensis]|uniref:Glutamine amidotransferase n=1 Tax=Legionella beliardensis TaxID=91822 RepID=A0A378I357_9GAMM|nr:class II glutamine amidotransferase [Legionella beliardensis]STX29423.1 glutamine amidotransferase [Legionella beliardensis]